MATAKRGDLVLVDRASIGNRIPEADRFILATAVKLDGSGKVSWARTDSGSFPAGNVFTLRSFAKRADLAGKTFATPADAKRFLLAQLPERATP